MTGVKNKAAFRASAKRINDMLSVDKGTVDFAVVMLDCNNLKKINDWYGHDKGDIYLQTACALICRIFTHSPVFRLGGDEFVVLLQNADYLDRDQLLKSFRQSAAEINRKAEKPWECIHIAVGLADYEPKTDTSVENVLNRADERMYADKKRQKSGRK